MFAVTLEVRALNVYWLENGKQPLVSQINKLVLDSTENLVSVSYTIVITNKQ